MKKFLLAAVLTAAVTLSAQDSTQQSASAETGTLPPPQYVTDYYAPPPDWIPVEQIRSYTLNTRVPDLFWLKYDGAYTLALRIRPITRERIEKNISVDLIDEKNREKALTFSPEIEKRPFCRTVHIPNLNVPADDFIEISFKMKGNSKADEVKVTAHGVTTWVTAKNEDKETKCLDGFKSYKMKFAPRKGRVLTKIAIEVPAKDAYDPNEEYIIFDLNLKRNAPKARFMDLPQRQWITQSVFDEKRPLTVKDGIADIYAYLRSNPVGVENIDLPVKDYVLRPQTEKEKDGGFKVESVKETINGKEVPALRITLEKGPRCYLKFPVKFDATKFNTMSFLSKIELPDGLDPRKLYRDEYPDLRGTQAGLLNSFFDTFSFGLFSATRDFVDWNHCGVSQGLTAFHRQRAATPPAGWTSVALDVMNSDCAGNKSTFYPEVTHWCFYYSNDKIPEGKKVVITIVDPKVSSGVMLAGGEMMKYHQFLKEKDSLIMKDFSDGSKFLGAPETNRLPAPLPFIRDHLPQGEIIMPPVFRGYHPAYRVIVDRAVEYIQNFLKNKYGLVYNVPVLDKPSDKDNVKIILGRHHFAQVDKAQADADAKILDGTPGFAIRTKGKNIYIYGGNFNYAGEARPITNGLYYFLENNSDEILAISLKHGNPGVGHSIFEFSKDGNMDFVWGDNFLHAPKLKYWATTGESKTYSDRNFSTPDNWPRGTWEYGGRRQLSTNHCWSYGAWLQRPDGHADTRTPNEKWGLGENGKRITPGCYTSHPCLINILEDAKKDYLSYATSKNRTDNPQAPKDRGFFWKTHDIMGLWVEDTLNVCQCDKCRTPIRLANGSLVTRDMPEFLSTQFFSNACAMINAVNVHAKRDMQIESIGYFWMARLPLFEISRNYSIKFCPYIRKNYALPIYAPANDLWWRDFNRWSQLNIKIGIYEYFLFIFYRPWCSIAQYDIREEIDKGLSYIAPDSWAAASSAMEMWVLNRLFFDPSQDPKTLRKYFIWRTYREAAPAMEKFMYTIQNLYLEKMAYNQPVEFDDAQLLGVNACMVKSSKPGCETMCDELDSYLDEAQKAVKNPSSKIMLSRFIDDWKSYSAAARKSAETLKK